jgi:hypothetical protein
MQTEGEEEKVVVVRVVNISTLRRRARRGVAAGPLT